MMSRVLRYNQESYELLRNKTLTWQQFDNLLIKLQGINLVNQMETDKEKIIMLSELGLSPREIRNITGINQQYVYNVRSQIKDED